LKAYSHYQKLVDEFLIIQQNFLPIFWEPPSSEPIVFEVSEPNYAEILAGHKPIIGAVEFLLDFKCVAPF